MPDDEFVHWDTIQRRLVDRDIPSESLPRVIVVKAWTVQLKVKLMERGDIAQHPGYYVYNHIAITEIENKVRPDCILYKKLELSDGSDELKRRLLTESFTGVLLGCHPKKGGTDAILLDPRADGLYERIGIVRLKFLVVFNYGYGGRRRSETQIWGDWKFKKSWQTLRIG